MNAILRTIAVTGIIILSLPGLVFYVLLLADTIKNLFNRNKTE